MAVQPVARSAAPQVEAVVAAAQERSVDRKAVAAATIVAVLAVWAEMDMRDVVGTWFGRLASRIFVLLSAGQEVVATGADDYVRRSHDLLNASTSTPAVIPESFAGLASDGRSLEGLLDGAPLLALQRIQRGESPAVAASVGEKYLRAVVSTQLADAGRGADSVAIAATVPTGRVRKRQRYGWVRLLDPPSCSRCVVLAGAFYRWNDGFFRHDMCDCVHVPVVEDVSGDIRTNPYEYFKSLSKREQDETFGKANARAIRDGADISQVVNATRNGGVFTADRGRRYTRVGTTRRGLFGGGDYARRKPGVLRPTPWQLYRDSRGDQQEAIRLLRQFRYIL